MNPIVFQDTDTASDGGWKTTYMKDSSEGIQRQDLLEEDQRKNIKLKPRTATKPNRLENEMPGNIGRPESQMTQFMVRNRPERAPVLFQPSSPSTKEFYYAPVDVAGATTSNPLNLPHEWPDESPTNYGDNDLNLEVGQDGYSKVEQDSNFSRKPQTWRFKTTDNDLGLRRRGENLPDLMDVGIKEMVYPLQGGLRPIVFGATPRQKKQAKRINRKREPEAEQKVVEELAKKAEAPIEKKAEAPQAKPFTEKKPVNSVDIDGFKFLVEGDPSTRSAVITATEIDTGEEIVRYGVRDGEPVLEPDYNDTKDANKYIKALVTFYKNLGRLLPNYVPAEFLPPPPDEVQEKLGGIRGPSDYMPSYRGNVLQDPALEGLDMLDQEKLFTTIRRWDGDSYVNTADRLDAGTKQVLGDKPEGEGKYFSWTYVTPEESEKKAAKDVEKEGFTISPGEGVLSVRRLDGWKSAEAEVLKKRRVRPA